MLYIDREVADLLKTTHDVDRFTFVDRCNRISRKLIPLITPFHNTKVIVKNKRTGGALKGVIEHLPTKDVSFRTYSDGTEGIALWVNTGNYSTTHLYNAEDIQLEDEDLKNEYELNSFESQSYES